MKNINEMSQSKLKIDIQSEIGRLNAVLLHRPGAEVENMTPDTVQRALYSDILNLSIAQKEYEQLYGVLSRVAKVYEVTDLLVKVLENKDARVSLVRRICEGEDALSYLDDLLAMSSKDLARVLIEGLPAKIDSLTSYFKNEYYALYPLYNFYFTRDAAVTIGNTALVCKMANKVRVRESLIMEAIYANSGEFICDVLDTYALTAPSSPVKMEGGDIIIARDDIAIIGNGVRTSSQGIDFLMQNIIRNMPGGRRHVIVQQLPSEPESFIHLDMVFTLLDKDKCMIFNPLIMFANQYQTVHLTLEDGKVKSIKPVANILEALKSLGMDLKPIMCGGSDEWHQEREQWHSGANSFAIAPGKVITYARNIHTLEELDANGFNVLKASDVIEGKVDDVLNDPSKLCAIALNGSELPRGGGGPRCMTMPLSREKVNW